MQGCLSGDGEVANFKCSKPPSWLHPMIVQWAIPKLHMQKPSMKYRKKGVFYQLLTSCLLEESSGLFVLQSLSFHLQLDRDADDRDNRLFNHHTHTHTHPLFVSNPRHIFHSTGPLDK